MTGLIVLAFLGYLAVGLFAEGWRVEKERERNRRRNHG